jgi:hypothetical protein
MALRSNASLEVHQDVGNDLADGRLVVAKSLPPDSLRQYTTGVVRSGKVQDRPRHQLSL